MQTHMKKPSLFLLIPHLVPMSEVLVGLDRRWLGWGVPVTSYKVRPSVSGGLGLPVDCCKQPWNGEGGVTGPLFPVCAVQCSGCEGERVQCIDEWVLRCTVV